VHLVVVLVDIQRDQAGATLSAMGDLLALLLALGENDPEVTVLSRWMFWLLPLSQVCLMLRCSGSMSTFAGPAGSLVGSVGSAVVVMAVPL
jgi:hypothetical protein